MTVAILPFAQCDHGVDALDECFQCALLEELISGDAAFLEEVACE